MRADSGRDYRYSSIRIGAAGAIERRAHPTLTMEAPVFADAMRDLYAYNRWATQRVFDSAEKLTPEQLHTPGTAGHGSVRDTLVHFMRAQKGWLSWWDGSLSANDAYNLRWDPADYPDVAALRSLWAALEAQTQAFVGGLTDADMARIYENALADGQVERLVLSTMMLHVVNHGTQHRSEVAAMLTAFGQSPDQLDYIDYVFTRR
jgi:uncharacterized damage-inducible protein DinB